MMDNETMVTIDGIRFVTLDQMVNDDDVPTLRRYCRRARLALKLGDGVTVTRDGVGVALGDVTRKFPPKKSGTWVIENDITVVVKPSTRAVRADGRRFVMYALDGVNVDSIAALDGVRIWDARKKTWVGE